MDLPRKRGLCLVVVLGLITTPLIIDLLVVVVFGGGPIPRQNGKLGSAVHFILVSLCNYIKVLWIDTIFFIHLFSFFHFWFIFHQVDR